MAWAPNDESMMPVLMAGLVTHNQRDVRYLRAATPDHRRIGPILYRLVAQTADRVHIETFKAD
jgi:hypothetical protein